LSDLIDQLESAQRSRDLDRVALAAESAKSNDLRDSQSEQALQDNETQDTARAEQALAQIRERFPAYATLANPGAAALTDTQSTLGSDEALVVFIVGRDASYAMLVRPQGFSAVPVAIGEDTLAGDIVQLRKAFAPAGGQLPEFDLNVANQLYQALIAPMGNRLDGVNHLIVIPGTVLSNLPLGTLVMAPASAGDYRHAQWLVQRFALSEAPSVRAFVTLKQEAAASTRASRPFLGVGAPPFQGAGGLAGERALQALTEICNGAGPISPDLLRALPPLPDTAREVRDVGAHIGGTSAEILLGSQASERNVLAQPLDQFAVLYFATHGILPGELRCALQPALALAPPTETVVDVADDGLLQASQIASLKLNADLVVLSACNTAASKDGLGGGALEGLSDAFFFAGAHAVMASHWEVSSTATETLMTSIFDPSSRRLGLAGALRKAQLEMLERSETSHPFYWASFTIIGDTAAYDRGTPLLQAGNN
jgi:CHAT domain-containing protein